jgi:predicted ATPase/class 3 adenylate cyclase
MTLAAPSGTVTFLFTDLEGSTRLWEEQPEAMRDALQRHDELLTGAVDAHGGYLVKTTGDGIHAAFATADAAVAAAVAGQRSLLDEDWGETGPLKVRMGLHTGAAELREGDYYGPAVNRAARLMAAAHGGQIVLSNATEELVRDDLPPSVSLEDLGEHRLKDLGRTEHVFQVNAPGLPTLFAELQSLDAYRTNLPVQLTSFVGRDADVETVRELVEGHRIVTLTGPGGVGKTRLAISVAAESIDRFADGTWLVELASVEALPVVDVIAGVLGVEVAPARTIEDVLLDTLRSRSALLVIDNCEHVVTEVRRVVETILRDAPGVSILATSREGLRIGGEQLYSVPSLDKNAAARLFVDRAKSVDPTIEADPARSPAIARVCRTLDGIPLAIELAAARVSMFSLDDLAKRVEQRFRLLTGGRGRIERHQTLRAAIDWSYDLLTDDERIAFARLSVFAGGCTLEAAEAVLADDDLARDFVLDMLSSLIDKSLLMVDRSRPETRYAMLQTVRQYGEERLVASGDAEAVRARHVAWCVQFARSAGRGMYSPDEPVWLDRLEAEMDNLQVAVAWAVATDDADAAMRIGGAFPRQAMARPLLGTGYLAEQAMAVRGGDAHPARARVLAEAAYVAFLRTDDAAAEELLDRALAEMRAGAKFAVAAYTHVLALKAWRWGRYGDTETYEIAKEGLAMAEAASNQVAVTGLRIAFACQAMLSGREDEALDQAERGLADARRLHQPTLEATGLYALGMARSHRDPIGSIELLRQARDELRMLGIESEHGSALLLIAGLEARHGDARRGLEAMRELMVTRVNTFREAGPFIGGELFNRLGRPDVVASCDGYWTGHGFRPPPYYASFHDPAVVEARAALGEGEFGRHAVAGAAMEFEPFVGGVIDAIDELLAGMPAE